MRGDYEKGLHDARLSIADFVLHIQRRLEDPAKSAYADNAAYWMAIVGGAIFRNEEMAGVFPVPATGPTGADPFAVVD